MLLKLLIIISPLFLVYVDRLQASEAPSVESLQKRLLLLEKEILDLKMKNVVDEKFEWQFLKMTEIENDIKRLHNRFEILENNYYKELKNLKASIMNSDQRDVDKIENLSESNQKESLITPSTDTSESLESLRAIGREDELFKGAINLCDSGQNQLAEQRFSEFIEGFPLSLIHI